VGGRAQPGLTAQPELTAYPRPVRRALLEPLVFSSAWVAAAAAALACAAALAMDSRPTVPVVGLAFCGTLVIYNVDRLRDLPRDRVTAPRRSAFVERWRHALVGLVAVAALVSVVFGWRLGPAAIALLAPVLFAGLLHRRLKRFAAWKPVYLSAAWTLVVVGLPAIAAAAPQHLPWIAAITGVTIVANAIASNLRDDEAWATRFGAAVPVRIARGCAVLAILGGLAAPGSVRPLLLLPLATLLALLRFRSDELYGLVVVDGALLVGALLALPLLG